MLARYRIPRIPPPGYKKPDGKCIDIRYRWKRRCLAPPKKLVLDYLENPSERTWKVYEKKYLELLKSRYTTRKEEFDEIVSLAKDNDVHLGCSCPTIKNPDVYRCHTVLALRFMKQKYPRLKVKFPQETLHKHR